VIFAPGVDRTHRDGSPRQFGNVIATRLPVREIFRHALPWPADPDVASMPRVALEVTVQAGSRLLRVICTHLEFYSTSQRAAQADALRDWHARLATTRATRVDRKRPGPFTPEPRPSEAILCGDFNSRPEDGAYLRMLEPMAASRRTGTTPGSICILGNRTRPPAPVRQGTMAGATVRLRLRIRDGRPARERGGARSMARPMRRTISRST
jgi:endonuclease/exonuclease/phosphatase family metal-dependent hydrolase